MYFLLNVCRLCLSYKNELYDLCCDDIMEKLVACISDLEFEDHVPSVICEQCLEQVDLYYEFRNKCLRSEFIINNYVEKLLGGKKNSQLRSKLQVKLAKNFSTSKFPSNVKLRHPTLLADSSTHTNMNKTDFEDSKLEEVHTGITERVKLRKRRRPTRTFSTSIENEEIETNTFFIDRSNSQNEIYNIPLDTVQQVNQNINMNTAEHSKVLLTTENLENTSPYGLNSSVSTSVVSEESNGSAVSSIIAESLNRSFHNTSPLPATQTSIQDKNCHLQAFVNSNHELDEPRLLSISLKRKLSNQSDGLNSNVTQEDCNKLCTQPSLQDKNCHLQASINSNHELEEPPLLSISLKRKLSNQSDSLNSNVTQEDCNKLCTQPSLQDKNCHLQASINSNHELEEPPLLSISLKRKLSNQSDSLNSNVTQEDCNKLCTQPSLQDKNCHLQASANSNHELEEPPLISISLKRKLSNQSDSLNLNVTHEDSNRLKENLDQNQTCSQEVPVTLNQDQIYSEEVPITLTENVESNMNDTITVINEEPPVYEIDDEDDDPPDEINRMMLLESLLRSEGPRPKTRVPALKIPIKTNYGQLSSNTHISVREHNYSGHIYFHNQKKLKITTGPTIGCSSSSDEIDVEAVSETEETKYLDEHVVKILRERIRRNTLRTYFKDLIRVVPTSMIGTKRSKVDILNGCENYIKVLEQETIQNMDEVQNLKEKNLQLKERLNEIRKQR